jgi:hypothetical protein
MGEILYINENHRKKVPTTQSESSSVDLFCKTKIRDLDVAFCIKKEILRLPQIHKTKRLFISS